MIRYTKYVPIYLLSHFKNARLHQIQSQNSIPVTDMGDTEVEQPQQKR